MDDYFEILVDFSVKMARKGMCGEYEIIIHEEDFEKFKYCMLSKYPNYISTDSETSAEKFKIAGPTGYITFTKRTSK